MGILLNSCSTSNSFHTTKRHSSKPFTLIPLKKDKVQTEANKKDTVIEKIQTPISTSLIFDELESSLIITPFIKQKIYFNNPNNDSLIDSVSKMKIGDTVVVKDNSSNNFIKKKYSVPEQTTTKNVFVILAVIALITGLIILLLVDIVFGVILLILGLGFLIAGLAGKNDSSKDKGEYQDVVYLKNGSVIRGLIIEQIPNQSLKIQTKDGSVFFYKMDDVEKITKEQSK